MRRAGCFRTVTARALLAVCAALAFRAGSAAGQAGDEAPALPSFAELEAAGAVIGEIRIENRNIFNLEDEKENNALFRLANALHIRTRPSVIERQLLFKSGERVSERLIEETERLLRTNRFVYEVSIRPIAYRDGVVDIEVRTRDTWSLAPGISFSRTGGANRRVSSLREFNALGTGVFVGFVRTSDVDRTASEYRVTQRHAFGGWGIVDFATAQLSDGKRESFELARPFYALDTETAGGISASRDTRVDSQFAGGTLVGQYRHSQERAEAYGGWSRGLVDGWAQRYALGASYESHRYAFEPDRPAPPQLPADQTYAAPFFRYEIVQDDFEKVRNRDQIARPEFFAMGFQSLVQIGRALTGLGSTRSLWTYSGRASNGFKVFGGNALLASTTVSGTHGEVEGQSFGGSLRFYGRKRERSLFFASLSADIAHDPDLSDPLLLGGDNGMRGYPLRYQSGDRRVVLTLEERGYTDLYVFQLFRIGGAIFWDIGRAWGGQSPATARSGWLTDVGFGLRILSARTAFGNVLHADFAFPLVRDPNIRSFQFSLEVKSSF